MLNSIDNSVKKVWSPLPGSQTLVMSCPANVILYHGSRGPGKGLPLSEPVYTESGPVPIGSLKVGDSVCCPDGTISKITGVFPQGFRRVFEITFADGSTSRCDDQHIWNIHIGGKNPAGSYDNIGMLKVLDYFRNTNYRLNIPTLDKIQLSEKPIVMDPYLLGLLLGDGCFAQRISFCTIDNELAEYVLLKGFKEDAPDKRNNVRNFSALQNIKEQVSLMGMLELRSKTKYIPSEYLNNSEEIRLAVLQGLMDTDGSVDPKGYITFCSSSEQLAKDVQYLCRSLGAKATLTSRYPKIKDVEYDEAFQVYIQPAGKFSPCRLPRKLDRIQGFMHKHLTNKIVNIVELEKQETVCIKIAHDKGLFITNDFVVTHNTDAQLMRFRQNVGKGYGRFWRGVIFDREYKNLDDLVSKSMRWFPAFKDGARFLSGKSDYRWVWPTGEELLFRVLKRDADYWGYHGQEFAFIGWNELTKFGTGNLFEAMMSCNRTSFRPEDYPIVDKKTGRTSLLPKIPLEVMATCNPHGIGHNWVKKKFINAARPGVMFRTSVRIFNPQTQKEEDVVKTQVHLFGSYRENKYLSPEYVAELNLITDPNKKKAWLGGSWDIIAGGMFDDVWDTQTHVIKPFPIPISWKIDRSFDWGSSKPFSVGWWAESDGSDYIDAKGVTRSTVRGDLFRIGEWYGTSGKTNEGLRMLATDVATGIIERELAMRIHNRVVPGPADNSIFDTENGNSIAKDMEKRTKANGQLFAGVKWTRCDKSAGSRKAGWEKLRLYMSRSKKKDGEIRERPGLFVFDNCKYFIDLVPVLPRDEVDSDDVDTDAEDHIGDEARYKILSTSVGVSSGKTKGT